MILQKKLNASWSRKMLKARERPLEAGERYIRAIPIPIRANKIVQTMGNTIPGGESGGFMIVVR